MIKHLLAAVTASLCVYGMGRQSARLNDCAAARQHSGHQSRGERPGHGR